MQLADRKSDAYRHVFETVVSDCLEEGLVGGLDFTVDVPDADANRQLSTPSTHRNAVRASQATARFVAASEGEGKAGMKKCGAQNPITALDGALYCAYLDAEIDRRCLARCAMIGKPCTGAPIVLSEDQHEPSPLPPRDARRLWREPAAAHRLVSGSRPRHDPDRAAGARGRKHAARPHTDARTPDRKRFFADLGALWQQDLANVEAGVYPIPVDHDGSFKMLLDRSRLFFEDLPAIRRRRESGDHSEVLSEETRGKRPRYYLQNFHFQSAG